MKQMTFHFNEDFFIDIYNWMVSIKYISHDKFLDKRIDVDEWRLNNKLPRLPKKIVRRLQNEKEFLIKMIDRVKTENPCKW